MHFRLPRLAALLVENPAAMRKTWVRSGKIPWQRERLPTPVIWLGEFHGLESRGLQRSDQLLLSLFHQSFMKGALVSLVRGIQSIKALVVLLADVRHCF